MSLFVFLSLIFQISCIKIAYIGYEDDLIYSNFLSTYDSLHEEINITLIEDDGNHDYSNEINTVVQKSIETAIIKCNDEDYNANADALVQNKVLVICTNTYSVGRCSKSIISGVSVIPLIENVFTQIGINYGGNVSLVFDTDSDIDNFYIDRFKATASLFGVRIIYSSNISLEGEVIDDYLTKTVSENYTSVVTLLGVSSGDKVKNLLKKRYDRFTSSMTSDKYPIYFLPGILDYNLFRDPEIADYNMNNIIISGYTGKEDYNITNEYKNNYTNVFNNASGYEFAVLAGVLDGILEVSKNYPTAKVQMLLPFLYNKPLPYPGGEMYILHNNYITLKFTFSKVISTEGEYRNVFEIPYNPDFEVDGYYGEIEKKTCNLKANPVDGISEIDVIPIGFILDMLTYKNKFVRLFIDKMIYETGYVIGKKVTQLILDVSKPTSDLVHQVLEYFHTSDLHTIYVISDYEKMIEFADALYKYDIQIFYIGPTPGENCFKNIVFGDFMTSNYASLAVQYIKKYNYDRIFIVGSTLYYGKISRNLIIEELKLRGYQIENIGFYDMVRPTVDEANNITKQINEMPVGDYNRTAIVLVVKKTFLDALIPVFYDNGMAYSNNFTIISYLFDELIIDENRDNPKKDMYRDIIFMGHSSNDMKSTVLDPFRDDMLKITARNIPIFPELGVLYNLFSLLIQSIQTSSSVLPSVYKDYLFYQAVKIPAYSQYQIYYSGYAQGKLSMFQVKSTSFPISSEVLFEQISNKRVNVFYNKTLVCKYSDGEMKISKYKTYKVVMVYDKYSDSDIILMEYYSVIFDMINQDGGIGGRDVIPEYIHFSNLEELKDAIIEVGRNAEDVLCYCGTKSRKERDAMADILVEQKKLLFSLSPSGGEVSYQNILMMNTIPNQRLEWTIMTQVAKDQTILFVYLPEDEDSINTYNYLKEMVNSANGKSFGIEVIPSDDDWEYIAEKINNITEPNYDKYFLYTNIDNYTELLMTTIKTNYPNNNVSIYVVDYISTMFKNKSNAEMIYYTSCYYDKIDKKENKDLKNFVDTFKGDSNSLLNNLQIPFYISLLMMKNALNDKINRNNDTLLRNYFYSHPVLSPLGKTSLFKNNYMSFPIYTIQIIDGLEVLHAAIENPVMPEPFLYLLHNNVYIDSDYSVNPPVIKEKVNIIGIAYIMDITDIKEEHYFYTYISIIQLRSQINDESSIKNRYIRTELHDCPGDQRNASDLMVILQQRGIDLVIGGCNPKTRRFIAPSLESSRILFFYTSVAIGDVCEETIYYSTVLPNQEVYPFGIYFSTLSRSKVSIIYYDDGSYDNRVKILKSMLDAFEIDISLICKVNQTRIDEDMKACLVKSYMSMNGKGKIVAFFASKGAKVFFDVFNEKICKWFRSREECVNKISVYLFDESHTHFDNNNGAGHYVISSFSYNIDEENLGYVKLYQKSTGRTDIYPSFYDAAIYTITMHISEILKDSGSFNVLDIKKQIYETRTSFVLGNIGFDVNNRMNFALFIGRINETTGNVDYYDTITESFDPQPYYTEFNAIELYGCNWKDSLGEKYLIPTIMFGVILPYRNEYFQSSIRFLSGLEIAVHDYNDHNGGVNGKFIQLYVFTDGNKEEIVKKRIREVYLEYDITYYFGGWEQSIRIAANEALKEFNGTLLVPNDYEGGECLANEFYYGLPANSYSILLYWIKDHIKDTNIIIYSRTLYAQTLTDRIKNDLAKFSHFFDYDLDVPLESSNLNRLVTLIQKGSVNGALIVTALEGAAAKVLIEEMDELNMKPPQYITLNTILTQKQVFELGDKFLGHYYVDTENVNDEIATEMTNKLKDDYYDRYAFFEDVSRPVLRGYGSFDHLCQLLKIKGSFDRDAFRSLAYNTSVKTILGDIVFRGNNHIDSSFKILSKKLLGSGEELLYSDYEYSYPIINNGYISLFYRDNLKQCDIQQGIYDKYEFVTVGLIFDLVGEKKDYHKNAIYGSLVALHKQIEEGLVLGKLILPISVNYYPDLRLFEDILETRISDNDLKMTIGCSDAGCKSVAQKVCKKHHILFFYTHRYYGQECDYDTFYLGPLPNQYIPQILEYFISTSIIPNLVSITEDGDESTSISTIIESQGGGMYFYGGDYIIDSRVGIENSKIQSLLNKMEGGGGLVMFTISDTNLLKKFLIAVNELSYDKTKYIFVDTRTPVGKYESFDANIKENVYLVAEYFAEIESESNEEFKKEINNYAYITEPTALTNAAYLGTKIWLEAVKEVKSFDTDLVRDKLLEIKTHNALGEFVFDVSHYTSSPFYIGKFFKDGKQDKKGRFSLIYSKPRYEQPRPWSWDIPETYRMMCSFAPSVNNSKYEIEAERVLLVSSLSGDLGELNKGEIDIFKMAIEEINNKGGVNGIELETAVYDILSNIDNCGEKLIKNINKNEPKVIFFSEGVDCLSSIDSYIKSNDILFINLFKYPMGNCEQHIFTSNDHVSLYDPVLNVLRNRNYDEFLITLPKSMDYDSGEYIYEYLDRFNEKVIIAKSYDEISNQIKIFKESLKEEDEICIIFSGYLEDFDYLIEQLKDAHLSESQIHLIVADPTSAILTSKYNNYEVIQSYYLEDEREINQKFVNNAYQRLKREVIINDILSGLYSAIKLWAKAVDSTNSFSRNLVRKELINQEAIDLPEGLVGYGVNQYLGRIMKISHKDLNNEWKLVYNAKTMHYPQPFTMTKEGDYYFCDFNDLTIGAGKPILTYTIGIVLSLTGVSSPVEKPIFDSILAGITYLNGKEQLLAYQVYYKLYDVESNRNNYKSIFEKIDKDGIDFIFGGYDPDDYPIIANEMKDRNKVFFFCGHTYSEICPKNVIVSELHPSQIATMTIRRLLEDTTSAITVYSPSNYTRYVNGMIQARMSYTNILLMGDIEYNLKNTQNQLRIISQAMPNGGYIIATFENKEYYIHFYKAMYELGLRYPKYIVYNTLFDENIFNDLESKYLSGHIVIGSYFESIQSKNLSSVTIPAFAATFSKGLHIHIGDKKRIRTQYESAYALLLFWKNMCQNSNSIDPSVVEFKYDYQLDVPSGSIELAKNNIFKRNVYSGYITENNEIYVNWLPSKSLEADVYNQMEGKDIGYICDWKTEKSEKFYTEPIHVAFLHEIDIGGKSEQQNLLIQDMTIEQLNSEGGVNGRNIVAEHYFITHSRIYATVRTIDQETDSLALFGCMSSKCRDEVNRYLSAVKSDFMFYFIGTDDGNLCSSSVISMGMTVNQKIIGTISYLESIGNTYIFILGNTDNSTSVIADYIKKYVKDQSVKVIGEMYLTPYNENAYTDLYDSLNSLISTYKSFCILNLFRGKDGNEFINHFKATDLQKSAFVIVILNYDESDFSKENLNELSGSYITTSFTDSLTSTEAEAYIQTVKSYFQNAISLNEMYEVSYSSLYLWKLGIEYASEREGLKGTKEWPSLKYRQLSIKYVSFNSPSGNLVIKYNNHVTKPIYLFRIMSGRLSKVYPSQGKDEMLEPKMTYMDNSECEMGKTKVLYETNNALRILVMVLMIILILVSVASLVGVISYRHLKIIMSSSPLFLSYTLIALIMLSVSGFIFTLVPNDVICAMRVWLVALSVNFLFGILLCKAWRIHKLFNNKEMKKVKISNMMLLEIIGGIELVQIIYLTIWWIVDPSVYTETYSVDYSDYLDDVYVRECTENDIFTFIEIGAVIAMFLYGARLSWKTRKASAEFNESKTLASIIGIMIVVGILEIPLNLMMAKQPDTLMMLRGIGVELCVIAVLVLQFAAKLKMFFYYFTTTTMGSSSSVFADSRHSRSMERKTVNRGRFRLKPNIFEYGNLAICTISTPDAFYVPSGNSFAGPLKSARSNTSAPRRSNVSTGGRHSDTNVKRVSTKISVSKAREKSAIY